MTHEPVLKKNNEQNLTYFSKRFAIQAIQVSNKFEANGKQIWNDVASSGRGVGQVWAGLDTRDSNPPFQLPVGRELALADFSNVEIKRGAGWGPGNWFIVTGASLFPVNGRIMRTIRTGCELQLIYGTRKGGARQTTNLVTRVPHAWFLLRELRAIFVSFVLNGVRESFGTESSERLLE